MDNSTCPAACVVERGWFTVFAVVYSAVLVVGLPLNAVSLWVLLCRHGLRSSSAVLMTNLALSDLLLGLSLPLRVYYYATTRWPFGTVTCVFFTALFRSNIESSSVFITLISLDRLLAVVFPLRARTLRTAAHAWRVCLAVWILMVALSVPWSILKVHVMRECILAHCFDVKIKHYAWIIMLRISLVTFFLMAVNIISTVMVIRVLRGRSGEAAALVNGRLSAVVIFAMNLLMFVVFFLPLSIVTLLGSLNWVTAVHITVCSCFVSINCCLDPLVYYFSLDSFWREKEEHTDNRPRVTDEQETFRESPE